jgi:hypothetical protein
MKNIISILVCVVLTTTLALAGDLPDNIQGKWSVKRTNSSGEPVIQKLVFKGDTFEFRMMSEGGSTLLFAKGKAKVETAGKVKVIMLSDIKAGQSESETESVDMEYQAPVRVSSGTMYLASGLDEEREEAPRVDAYKKE